MVVSVYKHSVALACWSLIFVCILTLVEVGLCLDVAMVPSPVAFINIHLTVACVSYVPLWLIQIIYQISPSIHIQIVLLANIYQFISEASYDEPK